MTFFEILGIVISAAFTLLGGVWALFKFYDNRQDTRVMLDREVSLKISELQVKVLRIEQDLSAANVKHEIDFASLRKDLMSTLAEFKAEHKYSNSIILTKLDSQNEILIRFSTSFENHIENHTPKRRTHTKKPTT